MHTNEIVHDTFIPRWFGRLGNNIQQISNGIYFCEKNNVKFTSPDHPFINAIELTFGNNEFKISESSHNWFYFFEGPDKDFDVDINDLNFKRKEICEKYILPNLKINHDELEHPLEDDVCVAHIRSGDVYSHAPHPSYVQNPLSFYLELYKRFKHKVIFITEDNKSPITQVLKNNGFNVNVLDVQESLTLLLRAKAVATSGIGTFALAAAICSKNIKELYCTNLSIPNALNPSMLKEHLDVYNMDINGDKYIRVGEWNYSENTIAKVLNYKEDILFRRL
jgi:hypothetical protein